MSIQISGGGPGVAEIQSGLATAAAVAALATSVAGREQALSVNAPNHIAVTVDFESTTWNTVGTHEVFTVTGAVRLRLWVETDGNLASLEGNSAFMSFGVENNIEAFYGSAGIDGNVPGFWIGASSYSTITTTLFDVSVYGVDVGYEITEYAMTDGTLIFHCVWEPLSVGATVVAGAGGPL